MRGHMFLHSKQYQARMEHFTDKNSQAHRTKAAGMRPSQGEDRRNKHRSLLTVKLSRASRNGLWSVVWGVGCGTVRRSA